MILKVVSKKNVIFWYKILGEVEVMEYNKLFIQADLPEPFTIEELYYHFEKMHAGDLQARKEIIERNIRFVIMEVNSKFSNVPNLDVEELFCVGVIGLIKSVDTFDISKEFRFATYAVKCIDNEILMFLRKSKKHMHDDYLGRPLNVDLEGSELTVQDIIFDDNADFALDYEKRESYAIIRRIVSELPERDKDVIMWYFGFLDGRPLTQKEIAELLGISQSYVCRMVTKILKKIEIKLQLEGIVEKRTKVKEKSKIKS